jgi:hypothetical protein
MSRSPPNAGAETDGARPRTGGCGLLLILLAAVWVGSIGIAGGASRDLSHPLSIEAGDLGAKALRPQASVLWRNPSGLRKEAGASKPQAAGRPDPGPDMEVAPRAGRPEHPPWRHQSFLTCRTWNPRAPPLARG